jgi:hypothetical protein
MVTAKKATKKKIIKKTAIKKKVPLSRSEAAKKSWVTRRKNAKKSKK